MYVTKDTKNIRNGLSDREAFLLSRLSMDRKSIIGHEDVAGAIHASYPNARKVLERLAKKRWLIRIMRNRYLISPLSAGPEAGYTEHGYVIAASIAAKRPHYIAYWTALNHYGFTEQMPMTVSIATTMRIPNRKIHGVRYEFVTIDKKKFFGVGRVSIDGNRYAISDKNKTITDALDHPEYCGGIDEVAKCLWNARDEISFEEIINNAQRMQNSTIIKRMGYLADVLEIDIPSSTYDRMLSSIHSGYSVLETLSKIPKKADSKWRLFINMPKEMILEAKVLT